MNYESKIYFIKLDLTNQAASETSSRKFTNLGPPTGFTSKSRSQTKSTGIMPSPWPWLEGTSDGVPLKWRLAWPWSVWFRSRMIKQQA